MANPFKRTFELVQHTPLIHFQHDQAGATLRATEVKAKLWAEPNTGGVKVKLRGRGVVPDQEWTFADSKVRQSRELVFRLPEKLTPGRYVFAVCPTAGPGEFADPWLAVDVE